MNAIQAIAYKNGAIRKATGALIAFYDAESKTLTRNGATDVHGVPDILTAMEIIGNA
jgi:hypothetical protein